MSSSKNPFVRLKNSFKRLKGSKWATGLRPFVRLKNSIKKLATDSSVPLKEQLGYASGRFGNEMGQDIVGTFLTIFLAKYVGIEALTITVLMGVSRILNVLCDPAAGSILDRGLGRKRKNVIKPFLLLTPFPIAVTSILLFIVPAQNMAFRIVWVFVFYFIYNISDNFYDMSLSTMSVRMCSNPKDRKNFYTLAQFAGSLGTTLPGGLVPIFVSMYKEDFSAQGYVYLVAATVFGILGLVAMLVPYFTLKERNPTISVKQPKVALSAKAIFSNKPLLLVTGAELAEAIRKICYGALAFFYSETLDAFWLATVVGAVSVVLNYAGMLLMPIIPSKVPPRNILVYGYLYSGICFLLLLIIGYQSLLVVGILIAISGFPNGMIHAAKKIILADSTEYMEWKTWKKYGTPIRSDGMVFAMHSMGARINNLWSSILLPLGLTVIGYVSAQVINGETHQVTQSPETLRGIFYLVTIPGIVGNFIPGLIMSFDNYIGERKVGILAELAEMHAGFGGVAVAKGLEDIDATDTIDINAEDAIDIDTTDVADIDATDIVDIDANDTADTDIDANDSIDIDAEDTTGIDANDTIDTDVNDTKNTEEEEPLNNDEA